MNIYKNSINSLESKNSYDELSRMPKWAMDEQIYNCDNLKETKEKKKRKASRFE